MTHNGSGSDIYVVLNNLPQWKTVVSLFKNGSGFVSPEIFNGYVDENKKIPQYVHFRCGRNHINNSLNELGISYILQPSLLKQERIMMKAMRTLGKIKNVKGYLILKMTFHQLLLVMLDIQKVWKK